MRVLILAFASITALVTAAIADPKTPEQSPRKSSQQQLDSGIRCIQAPCPQAKPKRVIYCVKAPCPQPK